MAEHLLEMAKALVLVRDGKITVLTDPQIRHCPLRSSLYGCEEESRETVERVLRQHMDEFGMYGPRRVLESKEEPISFGASEMVMDGMAEGLVDAAVVVCEGAGTVIGTRPEIIQALGAHMTGLIRTEPIPETVEGLTARGCIILDDTCAIDQVRGFGKAVSAGFRRIVVTITGRRAFEARQLREMGKVCGVEPIIFAVHNTGIGVEEAELLAEHADLVWGCASKTVREVVGARAKLQIGVSIPVFALTDMGKTIALNRAYHFTGGLVIHRANLPMEHAGNRPEPLM